MTVTPNIPPITKPTVNFSMTPEAFVLLTRYLLDAEEPADWSAEDIAKIDVIFGELDAVAEVVSPMYARLGA